METEQKKIKENTNTSDTSEPHTTTPPWLDLPVPLTELILERLPLSDYVRFAAVSPKWRSIQTHHRLRHSPLPPPILPLPWLVVIVSLSSNSDDDDSGQQCEQPTYYCYSPFENRFYHHLPTLAAATDRRCLSSSHGFSLLFDVTDKYGLEPGLDLFLFNLTTGSRTHLPRLRMPPMQNQSDIFVAMSDRGGGAILIKNHDKLCLLRSPWESHWIELAFSDSNSVIATLWCGGKFYCYCVGDSDGILIVNPLPAPALPTIEFFEMHFEIPRVIAEPWMTVLMKFLVECDGEVLLVKPTMDESWSVRGFTVFRADFSRRVWVKVESLKDWVVFLDPFHSCSFHSVLASDIGEKGNCIYLCRKFSFTYPEPEPRRWVPWKVFDLGSGEVREGQLSSALPPEFDGSQYSVCWTVPTLSNVDLTELR